MAKSHGTRALCISLLLLAPLAGDAAGAAALRAETTVEAPAGEADRLERGRYLAEQVALCIQCHTPRDEAGNLRLERKFQGAPVPVESPYPGLAWALRAPPITRMLGYDRESAVRLLSEGIARDGSPPAAPMPAYRMRPEDAEAIYEYLSSVTTPR